MRQTVRKSIKEKLGKRCCNCGLTENIEYHHIVPVSLGGTENIANIVPLCHGCHKAAHCGRNIHEYKRAKSPGRKRIASEEDSILVFEKYANGEIGNKAACKKLGYKPSYRINSNKLFKEYLSEKGIKSVHNFVDAIGTNGKSGLVDGMEVGDIIFDNGRVERLVYRETGENDVVYKRRKL